MYILTKREREDILSTLKPEQVDYLENVLKRGRKSECYKV